MPQQRRHYRLRYPFADRPRLSLRQIEFAVAELCEQGVRLADCGPGDLSEGDAISGEIHFEDGEAIRVGGKVLRHVEDEAVVQLQWGVPMERIIAEQRRLIRRSRAMELESDPL